MFGDTLSDGCREAGSFAVKLNLLIDLLGEEEGTEEL